MPAKNVATPMPTTNAVRMNCCALDPRAPSSRAIAGNAGNMVSIANAATIMVIAIIAMNSRR